MWNLTQLRALGAAAAIAFLAACSGGGRSSVEPVPRALSDGRPITSFYSCPATGPIEYLSDQTGSAIIVYAGKFASQAPCGKITSGVSNPMGVYVNPESHDLYVANGGGGNVLVFHRGKQTPYNIYADPTVQSPADVTMSKDGTVFASNTIQSAQIEGGSISTWIGGRNGGRWIGNFPMTHDDHGLYITVQKNDTVYYDDVDLSGSGALWSVSCPYGNCGTQTQVTGVALNFPGGLGSDSAEDLLVIDAEPGALETFELPNPTPMTISLPNYFPRAVAISPRDHHVFISDGSGAGAAEYSYPSGKLVGTVPGTGGNSWGIALDPGHAPK